MPTVGTRRAAVAAAYQMSLAMLAALLLSCGDGAGPHGDGIARLIVQSVDPDRSGAVVVNDSVQLEVVLLDSLDHELPVQPATWHSSDRSVGVVSPTGLLHGVKPGRITVTAVVNRDTGAYINDVLPVAATLEFVPSHLGLVPGGVYDLSVIFRDSSGAVLPPEGRQVVWENSLPQYAVVEGGVNAHVTGLERGLTQLTATGSGASGSVEVNVETPQFFDVVAGNRQTCGRTSFEVVYCWGSNLGHALGAPIGSLSVAPLLLEGFPLGRPGVMQAVVPGNGHSCALNDDGEAWCWGNGALGQLGDGSSGPAVDGIIPPRAVAGGLHFKTLALGDGFTCGLTLAGAAYCWGSAADGALGNGTHDGIVTTPTPVSGGLTFTELSAHPVGRTVCGAAGAVWCWGRNANGQIGDGTVDQRDVPTIAPGTNFMFSVAVGARHVCALAAGAAYCWGDNDLGQLGQAGSHLEANPVDGDHEFLDLTAGMEYTCGAATSGDAYCWGANDQGQLGDGTTTQSAAPVLVAGGLSFSRLWAGTRHTCGRTSAGSFAYCWGLGEAVGSPVDQISTVPVRVLGQP